ncbi:hypothetical protein BCR34DRAFT_571812 [Clohesyomyces aquaticus]|uniref:Histone deacetylase interacting domain-containing protein n=1 Tax=Clohesyomyces aquaticus TaxID=1231657 RepID=A0A1Y1Z6Q9_9PLEO|nr:hypothetical protein BCR34DRAFT_571812 [Clohesyomyces aquaticus]
MNPAHRDGWPPAPAPVPGSGQQQTEQGPGQGQAPRPLGSFGSSNAAQQQSSHASPAQGAGPVLPPPSGAPFYSSNAGPTAHNQNLPALAGLTGPPHSSPHQSAQRPPSSESGPNTQSHQGNPQGPPYSLPGISQTLQQPQNQAHLERERELRERENREREMMESHAAVQQAHAAQQEELVKREAEQRDRILQERQHHEQAAHENHAGPIQIHQPVAVAPSTRTIHGPNGLLGQSGSMSGPNIIAGPMSGPNAPGGMFSNAPVQQGDTTPRMQHAVQPPTQSSMLMPFGGPPGPMNMGQGQQPILNDALSYLDQVKVQFADHPDVYNRFLDIMKDFKSGAIDTPGVIERVSSLFAGNPNLIQGFNTFLPPGYKIECGTNGDPNAIRVTTPMGTMVSTMPAPRPLSPPRNTAVNGNAAALNESSYYEAAQNRNWQQARNQPPEPQDAMFSPNNRGLGQPLFGTQQHQGHAPVSPELLNRPHPDSAATAAVLAHQQEQRGVSQLQNAVSAATGRSILSPSADNATPAPGQAINGASQAVQAGSLGAEKRGPVEFNHAISYVNKIKNRFASQPDIYKQFLEILQTYQRESKPIQDVYAQVTSLFSSAPDLLEDFKQFLPESAAQHRAQQQAARHAAEDAVILTSVREPTYNQPPNHQQTPRADTSRLPPMGNFAPTPTANRDNKRKRGERQGAAVPASAAMPTPMTQDVPMSSVRSTYGQGSVNKRAKTGHASKQTVVPDGPPVSPTLTPALPGPLAPTITTTPNQEELAFFDRVKKHIGNKSTMNEFLKLCNLFSQDLIDRQLLLYRANTYIGNNTELFTWFRRFLGDEDEPVSHTRPKTVNNRVSLSNCRSLGPSYRLLPKRERERQCSGRDELCRSVLNDEWASHPTWASEDSGFVAHRKNQYEEGLHRIEEERHDYDFNIEACTRTIQQLEPIASQLLTMKGEDRLNFVLPPALGGQSETIYKRVIMKIYGREKGKDVITELFQMPWNVIPVLLNRLKSRLEDWKAAQREWEKVWREQTQKIFWKSLDHQSLLTKQADKRQFQQRSLQNEIHVRYEEMKRKSEINDQPQPEWLFEWSFKDEDILFDATRLIITAADATNNIDHSRVVSFIKEFVPLFFGIEPARFEQRMQSFAHDSSNESGEDTPSPDGEASQKKTKKGGDLRRNVLDPHGKSRKDKDGSVASGSRDSTPDVSSAVDDEPTDNSRPTTKGERLSSQWVEYANEPTLFQDREFEAEEPYRRPVFNMYANAPLYCMFRSFVVLYERLQKIKEYEPKVRETVVRALKPKPAHELKMIDKVPSDFFKDTSDTANYYQQVLEMFHDQMLGEVDLGQIEETLRRYYLRVGWQLYTFDRLLGAVVRFIVLITTNDNKEKTNEIYNLFKKDRVNENTTHKAEITYRQAVERHIKDADTYKIAYDPLKAKASVRLFKRDDPTFDFRTQDRVRRWRCYVAAYMALEPTEDVDISRVKLPFFKHRTFTGAEEAKEERIDTLAMLEDKVKIMISPASYAMKFEKGDEGKGSQQFFVQKDYVRSGLSEDVAKPDEDFRRLQSSRGNTALEKLVANSSGWKDMKMDDVEAKKMDWAAISKKQYPSQDADDEEEMEIL